LPKDPQLEIRSERQKQGVSVRLPRKKPAAKQSITGEARVVTTGFRARVYGKVREVPPGAITTYGDVAGALGSPRVARQVGFALAALEQPETDLVPWQRVLNHEGRISATSDFARAQLQHRLLLSEGIRFDARGRVIDLDLVRHRFKPPRR
jgi:methylated-DNA-protein-cysteine methyltransferase-like protein